MFRTLRIAAAIPLLSLAACAIPVEGSGEQVGSSSSAIMPCNLDSPSCRPPKPPIHGGSGGGGGGGGGVPLPTPGPQLDNVVYDAWVGYTITGIDFGAAQGSVHLDGNFANGRLYLQVTSWSSTQITAIVPDGTMGYVAQPNVSIGVTNAVGESNEMATVFSPKLSTIYLSREDALGVFCSSNGSVENAWPDPNYPTSLGGFHIDEAAPITQFGPTRVTAGSDYFYLPALKNGWAYVYMYLGGYGVSPLAGWDGNISSGMQVLEVDWSTEVSYAEDLHAPRALQHPPNQIEYSIDVHIQGPAGVPFR